MKQNIVHVNNYDHLEVVLSLQDILEIKKVYCEESFLNLGYIKTSYAYSDDEETYRIYNYDCYDELLKFQELNKKEIKITIKKLDELLIDMVHAYPIYNKLNRMKIRKIKKYEKIKNNTIVKVIGNKNLKPLPLNDFIHLKKFIRKTLKKSINDRNKLEEKTDKIFKKMCYYDVGYILNTKNLFDYKSEKIIPIIESTFKIKDTIIKGFIVSKEYFDEIIILKVILLGGEIKEYRISSKDFQNLEYSNKRSSLSLYYIINKYLEGIIYSYNL